MLPWAKAKFKGGRLWETYVITLTVRHQRHVYILVTIRRNENNSIPVYRDCTQFPQLVARNRISNNDVKITSDHSDLSSIISYKH